MKNLRRSVLIGSALPFILGAAAIGTAEAMNANTSSNCDNNTVQPYNGGASVSKFFTEPDGSGVTITSTGAVIKQGPCGTPYREGWVNPNSISGINSSGQIPKLQSGATNPFTASASTSNSRPSSSSSSSASSSANSSSTVSVTSTPATVTSSTSSQQTATAAPTVAAASTSAKAATSLPNTGPGNILALGAVTAFLGTIGHFAFQRLRLR